MNTTDEIPKKMRPLCADLDTPIWRYASVHAFLTLINGQCLTFHQFKRLQESDVREGMVPEGFWESMQDADIKSNSEDNRERLLRFTYANCWNMSEHENALMWKAYAPQGVAIKTTVGKLMGAEITQIMNTKLKGQSATKIEQLTIEYADNWRELEEKGYCHNEIPLNVLFLHLKRKAFCSEAEVRFRIQAPEPFPPQPGGGFVSPNPGDCPPWCPVIFKTLDWIDRVVTAPSTSDWAVKPIRQIAEQKGLDFRPSEISFREK
jgi:hypothetical protein